MSSVQRRDLRLLALAFAAGSVDAATYLGLGHAFPANMTGNTVLLGIAVAHGNATDALRSAVALGGFSIGVILGVLLVADARRRPANAAGALIGQTIVLAAILATWILIGSPPETIRYVLLGAAGVAMGLQSAAVRAAHTDGIATTYITGTLTNALGALTGRIARRSAEAADARHTRQLAESSWLLYALGALTGAIAETRWHAGALALPTAAAALAMPALGGLRPPLPGR